MSEPTSIGSFEGFWKALEQADTVHPHPKDPDAYLLISFQNNTEPLHYIWLQFETLTKTTTHFSESEKKTGKLIFNKLSNLTDQALKDWAKQDGVELSVLHTLPEREIRFLETCFKEVQ